MWKALDVYSALSEPSSFQLVFQEAGEFPAAGLRIGHIKRAHLLRPFLE